MWPFRKPILYPMLTAEIAELKMELRLAYLVIEQLRKNEWRPLRDKKGRFKKCR